MKVTVRQNLWGSTLGHPLVKAAIVLGVIALFVIDGASVIYNRMLVDDHAKEAGRAATLVVKDEAINPAVVEVAYAAAKQVADLHDETVRTSDFRVMDDGSVHLTVERTAPTIVLKHLPATVSDWQFVEATWLQVAVN